jgi:hypothetical protein
LYISYYFAKVVPESLKGHLPKGATMASQKVERGGIEQIVTRILRDARVNGPNTNLDLRNINARIEVRVGITNILTDDEIVEVQSRMVEFDETGLIKMFVEKVCLRI